MYDLLVIGGGPAGISAALTAHNRGRSVLVLSNSYESNPLSRAPLVTNYPGMDGVSGRRMLEVMHGQLHSQEIPVAQGKAVQVMPMGGWFACAAGSEVYESRSIVLAVGHMPKAAIPGEQTYLGRGVSYCATCDGMLYRGRPAAVLLLAPDAAEEANFLSGIGCRVQTFGKGARPADLDGGIPYRRTAQYEIHGDGQKVTGLEADGYFFPADGVFVLRSGMAADSLIPGLQMTDGHIVTDGDMATSVPGVFAAGDCVGKPYQVAKAVGEGNLAALSADRWISAQQERSQ